MRLALALFTCGLAFAAEPLIDAAKAGNKETLRSLLQKKTDANQAEPDGTTALHWAAYCDDAESADLLIKARSEEHTSELQSH